MEYSFNLHLAKGEGIQNPLSQVQTMFCFKKTEQVENYIGSELHLNWQIRYPKQNSIMTFLSEIPQRSTKIVKKRTNVPK